jgi:hypothetical protein
MEIIKTSTVKETYVVKSGPLDRWFIEVEQTDGFLNAVRIYDGVKEVVLDRAWLKSLLEVVRNYGL